MRERARECGGETKRGRERGGCREGKKVKNEMKERKRDYRKRGVYKKGKIKQYNRRLGRRERRKSMRRKQKTTTILEKNLVMNRLREAYHFLMRLKKIKLMLNMRMAF